MNLRKVGDRLGLVVKAFKVNLITKLARAPKELLCIANCRSRVSPMGAKLGRQAWALLIVMNRCGYAPNSSSTLGKFTSPLQPDLAGRTRLLVREKAERVAFGFHM
jgi:hypothetical protein